MKDTHYLYDIVAESDRTQLGGTMATISRVEPSGHVRHCNEVIGTIKVDTEDVDRLNFDGTPAYHVRFVDYLAPIGGASSVYIEGGPRLTTVIE